MDEQIILRGVRVHNLKNIDLDIPLNQFIVVTGVSGSGKSSLAFDTLYAEGQRRYIESLSAYARQFLERMDKPDADLIEGITPAIAIQQKAATKNPRSTVATVTEGYDYMRVLYARIGVVHCNQCGRPVTRDTIDAIVETLFRLPPASKALISFPWPLEKGLAHLKKQGFFRVLQAEDIVNFDDVKFKKNEVLDIFVDRISLEREERERLVDSLEMALKHGGGRVRIRTEDGREFHFSDKLECKACKIPFEDPFPNLFSFNSPQGACPDCHGFGDLAAIDEDKIVPDKSKSLEEGAIEPWTKPVSRGMMKEMLREARKRGIPTNIPFKNLKKEWHRLILDGGDGYLGVKGFFDWLQTKKYKVQVRVFLSRYRKYIKCPACGQMRLNPQALNVKVGGLSIGQVVRLTVKDAHEFFNKLDLPAYEKRVAEKLIAEIQNRLKFLLKVGLDYISLDRMTFTLSGGEAQRINLAAALSSSLVGTLFVLDEPSIGLHPRDNGRIIQILKSLKDIGNTVMVVEHDPEVIASAEHLIDLGPRAGEHGGEVMFSGTLDDFLKNGTSLTARYISGEKEIPVPKKRRKVDRFLLIKDAHKHNLKHLDVRLPLGVLTCITGVSGSGKSTLLNDVLYQGWSGEAREGFQELRGIDFIDKIILVDQSPISTSPRSIPATYTKAMDGIRGLFSQTREAQALGYKPGYFSFNTAGGRCEDCQGAGHQIVEMQFLSDVTLTCEACQGKRFKAEILEIKYRGKNIDNVLHMTIDDALEFFSDHPDITKKIKPLQEVGLGYLRLGQPTTTLSGGELQRIKLGYHLVHERDKHILYLFDEPTIGLHPDDVSTLLRCFQKLVEEGHSVFVIEHNLDVIKCADYIIDLGPEGGERGGEVIAQGSPEELVKSKKSITARYLKKHL
ncbi:MAG: excinuclease ABC subunit UvrA [Candidatus Aminicenantes bacterium]|nr:excinuclease ABC subunit UvrA [Candidatus Aminicenantes bacterium]